MSKHFDIEYGYDEDAGIVTYPKRALLSGVRNSLNILFVVKREDTDFACNKYYQGFRVVLHNPADVPRLANHFFTVPLDTRVLTAVTPELIVTSEGVKKFKPEKRECYMKDERPLKYFKLYTQSNCLLECLTNHTLKKCNCVSYFMPRNNGTPICGSGISYCVEAVESDLRKLELQNKINHNFRKGKNYCDCKPSCSELRFNIETSATELYWEKFFAVHKDIENLVRAEDNKELSYSLLSIYFKAEQFMTVERNELYGASDFISNFGGLLGLFTGFSLVSFAEIVYFLTMRFVFNRRLYGRWWGHHRHPDDTEAAV